MLRVQTTNPAPDATCGRVRWAPVKSLWITAMYAVGLFYGPGTLTPSSAAVFAALTAVTLCCGHSVGMHRLLIHRSFRCPRWLERALVHVGVIVGIGGPLALVRMHEVRDWGQRQPRCHDFLGHRRSFLVDGVQQLHCELDLERPPTVTLEPSIEGDRYYQFLQRTWMLQQLPLAALLYLAGGWSWVVWGGFVRVAVSVTGHWLVGHFAHRGGARRWHVEGASVQGYNLWLLGALSMGEGWHNNHHAFPGSARIGLRRGELDPGWWFIRGLARLGLAWDVQTPETLPPRAELRAL